MNHIEKIRDEVQRYFSPNAEIPGSEELILSPNGNYSVKTTVFRQTEPLSNLEVTKVEIYETQYFKLLQSFFVNCDTFFHSWVTKNKIEYLLCSEDLCGGQTVIDLTNNKMSSYTQNNDGFIWTKHLLSPNENLLAVFGCGWGTDYFVIVYHFDNPLELPLKIAYEPKWTAYDVIEWVDNKRLKVKNTSSSEESILDL
jgi:hypothetical protein